MSLKKLLHSDRCGSCKDWPGHRYCMRRGKNACWRCCNEMRVDGDCPQGCRYRLQPAENDSSLGFQYKTATDSRHEYTHLLQTQMERWARQKQQAFDGRIPLAMSQSETGREELERFLSAYTFPPQIPINHLRTMLGLAPLATEPLPPDHEDAAEAWLARVVEQDWAGTIPLLLHHAHYAESRWREHYLKRVSSHKQLRKTTHWALISSALTQDRAQGLVHLELNQRWPLTLHLVNDGECWRVAARIFAQPLYHAEEQNLVKRIALQLHEGKTEEARETVRTYASFYPDSADFAYFRGLLETFDKNFKAARELFFEAVEIDPEFHEARYNLALMHQSLGDPEAAKRTYKETLAQRPDDARSLNNLAAIFIDEHEHEQAGELLRRCLAADPEFSIARKNVERLEQAKKQ